ncbi:MAG TPA: DsbA family oxidoreductase [Rhizomicrobium sp.]|nr:DsbA family oxidoreductase [Rhizomicrobium sp.]
MQIDVIADTVCPWCFIGKRRLARALEQRPDIPFAVKWRPYRLDPSVPREGMDRQLYMRMKFGDDPQKIVEMHKLIIAEGEKDGIAFNFEAITRRPDTINSHRLIRWAEAAGVQDEVVERLFIAYFENGEDIGQVRVLADIADLCGMDGLEIAELLESDADIALVEREDQIAREMGVTGVPAMIFGGKLAVSGARDSDVLLSVINRAAEMQAGAPDPGPDNDKTEEEEP